MLTDNNHVVAIVLKLISVSFTKSISKWQKYSRVTTLQKKKQY